ncbi:hypothetical protein [Ferrimicrobium sp.]|jgi:hypothetical protein|uniref:hypothetical protein n=1 Tax=Ferrimicrobium sp. TaxID=2926050 RepID=UPI0026158D97|nr:hypothetical protein [Ferrimicrobium sp.]MCL5974027.1 hypothetical protein [Actinomycetota bacterium]
MTSNTSHKIGIATVWIVLVTWLLPILIDLAFSHGFTGWVAYAPLSGSIAPLGSTAVVAMTKFVLLVPLIVLVLWWLRPRLGRLIIGLASTLLIVGSYLAIHHELLRPTNAPPDTTQRMLNALTFTLTFSYSWLAGTAVILMGVAILGILVLALLSTPLRSHR